MEASTMQDTHLKRAATEPHNGLRNVH
jgi:hypothetical protein